MIRPAGNLQTTLYTSLFTIYGRTAEKKYNKKLNNLTKVG